MRGLDEGRGQEQRGEQHGATEEDLLDRSHHSRLAHTPSCSCLHSHTPRDSAVTQVCTVRFTGARAGLPAATPIGRELESRPVAQTA